MHGVRDHVWYIYKERSDVLSKSGTVCPIDDTQILILICQIKKELYGRTLAA